MYTALCVHNTYTVYVYITESQALHFILHIIYMEETEKSVILFIYTIIVNYNYCVLRKLY